MTDIHASSPLLIDESPLQVLPALAVEVGLNEAIILQQMHYWLKKQPHVRDGKPWIYNSYKQWQVQFPFWHSDTIKRAITYLEKEGYILSARYSENPLDKTKWYTINYNKLNNLSRTVHNAPTKSANCTDGRVQIAPMEECKLHRSPIKECAREDLKTETTTLEKRESGAKSRASRQLPADWTISSALQEWAHANVPHVNIAFEADKFRDHYRANGKAMKDWEASFRNWLRRVPAMAISSASQPLKPRVVQ